MQLTSHPIRYFAHELNRRHSSDSADAQVDMNPHQIEAALLFAFRNPFSKGAILGDEVGLGKTIEAGLLLSRKWAERKRKLLIILPANLRKQWSQELADKFFLPSVILFQRIHQTRKFESLCSGCHHPEFLSIRSLQRTICATNFMGPRCDQ
jgi:SNF2 family DNA or RNA helicase